MRENEILTVNKMNSHTVMLEAMHETMLELLNLS